ncbi:SDR family NAD(P)-dependent oxidoreductase [Labrys wisconsinensis]|uniref:3-oxoacyl-[acyl-carrier protein] reductase n=1 Tax=Labrys wisconsinensis TaxID=425677 RepID=A0ABU0J2Z0_9HYPH|nr:SDR family oxidoreductase [Labrys wisconsinensis]MDQ0467803.1 3-oxoacyl-[acyl-carrier protein] reductase [Labrys wisconsinensis]
MSGFDLSGKVAVVTGAQRGIGLGIAAELARAGAHVVLTGIMDAEGERAAAELRSGGLPASYRSMDMRDEAAVPRVVGGIAAEHGRLDIAVANAAIYPNTPISAIAPEEWDAVMAVNLRGPFLLAQACLPHFQRRRGGRVIFLSSITGARVSSPGYAHYAATKAGILGFMRTAALEFAPWNVTLNAVEPGNILTEGVLEHQPRSFVEAQRAAVPLRRLGTPEDVAHAVRFLASDEAAYITGQSIVVDGGQLLPEMATAILPEAGA